MSGHPGWQAVIGLEVHVQLATRSKIFSGAANRFGQPPNTLACPVDLGLPGVLPAPNEAPVRMAVLFGLAIGAKIEAHSSFDRKNYFYPDLPKGYQISQFERPVVGAGRLAVHLDDGQAITVDVVRAHLEEDAGKSIHDAYDGATGIDLNRAGTPLLEVVTGPDLRTPQQAATCFRQLHSLVRYLGICDGDLSQGSMRCDVNVSVRPAGQKKLGERAEVKNLNSFRFVEKAVRFEIDRQIDRLQAGLPVQRETRLYDSARDETRPMRGKEQSDDYRYFPDPDLPPLAIDQAFIDSVRQDMPELPWERRHRFLRDYGPREFAASDQCESAGDSRPTAKEPGESERTRGAKAGAKDGGTDRAIGEYEADQLTRDPDRADYFEEVVAAVHQGASAAGAQARQERQKGREGKEALAQDAKLAANWILGELSRHLNQEGLGFRQSKVSAAELGALIQRVKDGTVSGKMAKTVFDALWAGEGGRTQPDAAAAGTGERVDGIIEARGLRQVSDSAVLKSIVAETVAAHPQQAAQFRAGREKVLGFFVGKVMAATGGKANPQQANALLREALAAGADSDSD